jgi:hypothetical protein
MVPVEHALKDRRGEMDVVLAEVNPIQQYLGGRESDLQREGKGRVNE